MKEWKPSASDSRFVGSVPDLYDRHLGPLLFEAYADDLAGRVAPVATSHADVLEIAAGTGIFTKRLRARLPEASLTVTDLNEPMLAVARQHLESFGVPGDITWRVADAMALPFDDQAFDTVVSQFGVMFFPDKPRAAREAMRVLRPGGQWLFNVWGSWDENPFGRIAHETIASFFPADTPTFYRVPFGFASHDALRTLAEDAGFEAISIDAVERVAEAPSAADAALGMVRGNPVAGEIAARDATKLDAIVDAVADALRATFGDAPLRMPTRIHVVSATRPRDARA